MTGRLSQELTAVQPIYATSGEWVALLEEDHLYDTCGEWIGWLDGKEVYTRDGFYAGVLSDDGRILRRRVRPQRERRPAPPAPPKIRPPSLVPLPPFFAELPWGMIDVFEAEPEVFEHISDLRPDRDS